METPLSRKKKPLFNLWELEIIYETVYNVHIFLLPLCIFGSGSAIYLIFFVVIHNNMEQLQTNKHRYFSLWKNVQ